MSTKYNTVGLVNVNTVQQLYASSIICDMCVHVQEKNSKSKHNQLKSEKISKNFQSPTSIKPS